MTKVKKTKVFWTKAEYQTMLNALVQNKHLLDGSPVVHWLEYVMRKTLPENRWRAVQTRTKFNGMLDDFTKRTGIDIPSNKVRVVIDPSNLQPVKTVQEPTPAPPKVDTVKEVTPVLNPLTEVVRKAVIAEVIKTITPIIDSEMDKLQEYINEIIQQSVQARLKTLIPTSVTHKQSTTEAKSKISSLDAQFEIIAKNAANISRFIANQQLENARKSEIELIKQIQEPNPLTTKTPTRPSEPKAQKKRVVLLGLWADAVAQLDFTKYPNLDIITCQENKEAQRYASLDAILLQCIKFSAHAPSGIKKRYERVIISRGGYTEVRRHLETLNIAQAVTV